MGLDVRIVRVRKKNIDNNLTIKELYKKGVYVSEYRNTWDFINICNLSKKEKEDAICYRILNDLPMYRLNICGFESERLLEDSKNMDFDKFVYIVKADW